MLELKTIVVDRFGEVVKIGAWDFGEVQINNEIIQTNPLPDGYMVTKKLMRFDNVNQSWVENGKLSDKERIKQLEDMIITLLEVI